MVECRTSRDVEHSRCLSVTSVSILAGRADVTSRSRTVTRLEDPRVEMLPENRYEANSHKYP